LKSAEQRLRQLDVQLENVLSFIRTGGDSLAVRADLARLEKEQVMASGDYQQLLARRAEPLVLPSAEEIRQLALASFKDLARDSFEFARLLRQLAPRIVVYPYQLCDGGRVVLKARFRLELSKLILNPKARQAVASQLDRDIELELFEPPQREKHRLAVVALRKEEGLNFDQVGERLGITGTAAQYAARLQRKMDELGLSNPYIPLTGPPDGSRKLRRHLNPRYESKPPDEAT
jgi:site-specific DNA recombinase